MLVNEATFDRMLTSSQEINFGAVAVRIPSLQHLIALKLHVLKQGLEHRMLGDLDDVVQLVLANRIDLDQQEWKETFEKYGHHELYEKVRRATQSR
jgi:predicted nucleotidyltransferase